MKFSPAPAISENIFKICEKLKFFHIDAKRIVCYRSTGSSSRAIARIWSLPKIWQDALKIKPHYVLEVISEKFDKQPEDEKIKILIHELCLPYEEPIVIKTNRGLNITNIGNLIENEFSRTKSTDTYGIYEWVSPSKDLRVLSFNIKKNCVEYAKITKMIRVKNNAKKILDIITKDGRKISVTPDHPILYTMHGLSYEPPKSNLKVRTCPSSELSKLSGMPRLLELYKLPKWKKSISSIDITKTQNFYKNISNFNFSKSGRGKVFIDNLKIGRCGVKCAEIPILFKLDKELGQFFGFYLSEGSIDHKSGAVSFSFHINETNFQKFIEKILIDRFHIKAKSRVLKGKKCTVVYAYSRLLQVLIRDIFGFGEKARHKIIPPFVFSTPESFIAGLIDGWFAGDGTNFFDENGAVTLSAYSKSSSLIFGVLLLLARLGIVCRLRRDMHDILIQSFFVPKFYKYCKLLIDAKNLSKKVLEIKRMRNEDRFRHLKYIRIRSIKERDCNDSYFYNLEVSPNNNFMHACGLFTHNCHIPKNFSGAVLSHSRSQFDGAGGFVKKKIDARSVEKLFEEFKRN